MHVVLSGHRKRNSPLRLAEGLQLERITAVRAFRIACPKTRSSPRTESYGAADLFGQRPARHHGVGSAGRKTAIAFQQLAFVPVTFEMIGVRIQHDRRIGIYKQKILFVFACFGYEAIVPERTKIRKHS